MDAPEATSERHDDPDHHRHGTLWSTIANTLCTMVGGGVLAIPLAFSKASIIPGLFFCVMSCLLSLLSVHMLIRCCDLTRQYSFRALVVAAFPDISPRRIGVAIELLIVCSNGAALIVYTRIIADSLPPVFTTMIGHEGVWSSQVFWLLLVGAIFVVLSAVRRLNEMAIVASLGLTAVVFACIIVVIHFADPSLRSYDVTVPNPDPNRTASPSIARHQQQQDVSWRSSGHLFFFLLESSSNETTTTTTISNSGNHSSSSTTRVIRVVPPMIATDVIWFHISSGYLPGLSTIIGAFLYQMNVPPLYSELRQATRGKMMRSGVVALTIALCLYSSVGLFGYLSFGDACIQSAQSGGNVLNNYAGGDVLADVAKAVLVVHFLCAFPIYAAVARRSLHIAIFATEEASLPVRVIEGGSFGVVIVFLAKIVPGIGYVVAFSGAAFGTTVGITVPALIHYRLGVLFLLHTAQQQKIPRHREAAIEESNEEIGGDEPIVGGINETASHHSHNHVEQTPPERNDRDVDNVTQLLSPRQSDQGSVSFTRAWIYGSLLLAVLGVLETVSSITTTIIDVSR